MKIKINPDGSVQVLRNCLNAVFQLLKHAIAMLLLLAASHGFSNDITVSNIRLTGQNPSEGYTMVEFDVSWDNSWRVSSSPSNWDAAWVFVKFRGTDGAWQHAFLHGSGHTAPAGSTITVGLLTPADAFNSDTNPGLGVFIYRSADGKGTFAKTDVQLRWNYHTNGLGDDDVVDFQVFAIEMVFVPEGSFYVGDGTLTNVISQLSAHNTTAPFQITGESAITLGGIAPGNLGNRNNVGAFYPDDFNIINEQTLPAKYPKGYNSFYCMKYELTQQGYAGFLNALTRAQQNTRTATDLSVGITSVTNRYVMSNTSAISVRNGIRCDGTIDANEPVNFYCDFNGNSIGNEAGDGQTIVCNWLSWADVGAYLDWSCLRPMTELELEKACRGTATPLANEYAWGSTSITGHTGISNSGFASEIPSNAANVANASLVARRYPFRSGAFAKSTSTRVQSGASFYGVMEISGNLFERVVTVGNATGRLFTGDHGNGLIDISGNADVTNWPGTDAVGVGQRCGDFRLTLSWLRVSDRGSAAETFAGRIERVGIRGVRKSP